MKVFSKKRIHATLFLAVFAASLGFGVAQADSPFAAGCAAKPGCHFGGQRVGCCLPP